jgi:hypothetical protein
MQLIDPAVRDYLEIAGTLVTAVGFPMAIYSIFASGRNNQRTMDVQVVATVSMYFHQKWDAEWRAIMADGGKRALESEPDKHKLLSLLNWIDWVGVLIRRHAFKNTSLIFDTIGGNLTQAIVTSRDVLNEQGKGTWPGVFEVARRLRLLDKHGKISTEHEGRRR